MNCRTSAQHAVASLLAPDSVDDYNYLPYFYSRVFNLAWQVRACPSARLVCWCWQRGRKLSWQWVLARSDLSAL